MILTRPAFNIKNYHDMLFLKILRAIEHAVYHLMQRPIRSCFFFSWTLSFTHFVRKLYFIHFSMHLSDTVSPYEAAQLHSLIPSDAYFNAKKISHINTHKKNITLVCWALQLKLTTVHFLFCDLYLHRKLCLHNVCWCSEMLFCKLSIEQHRQLYACKCLSLFNSDVV